MIAEMLTKVFRLQNQGKMADPAALRETIPKGKVLGLSALIKAALYLELRLFCSAALPPKRPLSTASFTGHVRQVLLQAI